MLPKVNIGAIEGGTPYRPNYFPGVCSILRRRAYAAPKVRPVTIKYELDQVLEKLGIDYEMDI